MGRAHTARLGDLSRRSPGDREVDVANARGGKRVGRQAARGLLRQALHHADGQLRGRPQPCAKPRLLASGHDASRVLFLTVRQPDDLEGLVVVPEDVPRIRDVVREHGAKLVVVDPLSAGLTAGMDTHRDAPVRQALAPLAQLASEEQLALVAVAHFTKDGAPDALARTVGSVGFTAAARSVLAFGEDPDEEDAARSGARVLAHAKCNVGPLAPSFAYRVVGYPVPGKDEDGNDAEIETSKLMFLGEHSASADSLLAPRNGNGAASASEEAQKFLRTELAAGPRLADEMKAAAQQAGISHATLRRIKKDLGVDSEKQGFGKDARWYWMPPKKKEADDGSK